MTHNIEKIIIWKFVTSWILWIVVFVSFFVFFLDWELLSYPKFTFFLVFASIILLGLFVALKFAKLRTSILLNNESLQFDNVIFHLADLDGYFIDRETPIFIQLVIKTKGEIYKITSVNFGASGNEFENFLVDFKDKVFMANQNIQILGYYDIYVKQKKMASRFFVIATILVSLLNITYIYFIFHDHWPMNWKLVALGAFYLSILGFQLRNSKRK